MQNQQEKTTEGGIEGGFESGERQLAGSVDALPGARIVNSGGGRGGGKRPGTRGQSSNLRWKAVGRLLRRVAFVMFLTAILAGSLALLTIYLGPLFLVQLAIVVAVAYFVSGGRLRWFYVAIVTTPRDLK